VTGWFVDETYVKVSGRWRYVYRAVDQFGQVVDVLLAEQRDTAAARRFFSRALRYGPAPVEVTTDKAGPYLRVVDELVLTAAHVTERYGTDEICQVGVGCVRRPRSGSCLIDAGRSRGQGWPEATRWARP
jgi:transposase-like protein